MVLSIRRILHSISVHLPPVSYTHLVNRIDNIGVDGIREAKEIHDIFRNNGLKTEVLAASFKNSQQALELAKHGVGAATISPDVIEGLVAIDAVYHAVDVFIKDFESFCGEGTNMVTV